MRLASPRLSSTRAGARRRAAAPTAVCSRRSSPNTGAAWLVSKTSPRRRPTGTPAQRPRRRLRQTAARSTASSAGSGSALQHDGGVRHPACAGRLGAGQVEGDAVAKRPAAPRQIVERRSNRRRATPSGRRGRRRRWSRAGTTTDEGIGAAVVTGADACGGSVSALTAAMGPSARLQRRGQSGRRGWRTESAARSDQRLDVVQPRGASGRRAAGPRAPAPRRARPHGCSSSSRSRSSALVVGIVGGARRCRGHRRRQAARRTGIGRADTRERRTRGGLGERLGAG